MEHWKPVPDYEGRYAVSDQGAVKNLRTGCLLTPQSRNGYLAVNIDAKQHYIHRLVAKAFIPNPEGKPTVNHLDEDKHNNSAQNLAWATMQEQVRYGTRTLCSSLALAKPVIQCAHDGTELCLWEGLAFAERALGIPRGNIFACLIGKRHTAGGYKWKRS